jgi:4-methyl-5(b-hydroxyethyl)-thiazole monophosphate biosynthesis
MADVLFEEVNYDHVDMIILPGGMPGASNLNAHAGLKNEIARFNTAQKPLAAICAAPMVFGQMGILKGHQAVCYPGFENHLQGAEILYTPVVSSGHIITGRGIGAALEFALRLVEILASADKSNTLKKQMLIE